MPRSSVPFRVSSVLSSADLESASKVCSCTLQEARGKRQHARGMGTHARRRWIGVLTTILSIAACLFPAVSAAHTVQPAEGPASARPVELDVFSAAPRRALHQWKTKLPKPMLLRDNVLPRQAAIQPRVDAMTMFRRDQRHRARAEKKTYRAERDSVPGHHNREFLDLIRKRRTRDVNSEYVA